MTRHSRPKQDIELKCAVVATNDKAWRIDTGHRQAWILISQINDSSEADGIHTISIPEWLALKNDLI